MRTQTWALELASAAVLLAVTGCQSGGDGASSSDQGTTATAPPASQSPPEPDAGLTEPSPEEVLTTPLPAEPPPAPEPEPSLSPEPSTQSPPDQEPSPDVLPSGTAASSPGAGTGECAFGDEEVEEWFREWCEAYVNGGGQEGDPGPGR